jgi:proteasome accessory factor C
MSESELREDVSVLNVVNFGGGAYVLYAEVHPNGEIEVDPEPYSDTFERPARLLPSEARALLAAIELIGEHLMQGALRSARAKIEAALGDDAVREGLLIAEASGDDPDLARVISSAIEGRRLLEIEYWAPNEDKVSTRTIEPYALINGQEGWYVSSYDPSKEDTRHFRLDRIKHARASEETYIPRPDLDPIADIEGWPRTGEVEGSRIAHVWISPEQARWEREKHTVLETLPDGAVVVEWPFKGVGYLVKQVLKEAGDAAVIEPADVREAVLAAAERLVAEPAGR